MTEYLNFPTYYLIGVFISSYMVWFYLIKLQRPLLVRHLLLAIFGPLVWPLQILKHLYDLFITKTAKY